MSQTNTWTHTGTIGIQLRVRVILVVMGITGGMMVVMVVVMIIIFSAVSVVVVVVIVVIPSDFIVASVCGRIMLRRGRCCHCLFG